MSRTRAGYLLIADITGYTQYLSESELEHAQDTLAALLELLVENTGPPLVISRLAGDAVISYGFTEDFFQGQTFVEKIEETYVAFRKAMERLVLNNTCQCNACANIANLDLKFFMHFGDFAIHRISDHDELVGSEINLLHRLLKNRVTEVTGLRAYALYSEAAIQQLGVEGLAEAMTPHRESYEHLGDVNVWVQDMHPVWEARRGAAAVKFPTDRLWGKLNIHIDIPPERVWDYLSRPEFRSVLNGSERIEIVNRSQGRIAPGSVYQCYHGEKWVPQTILEWQPLERVIFRDLMSADAPDVYIISEIHLEIAEGGTKLTYTRSRPFGPFLWRVLPVLLTPYFIRLGLKAMRAFKTAIEADYRAHHEAPESPVAYTNEQMRAEAASSLKAAQDAQGS